MKQVILEMLDCAYLGIFSHLSFHPTIEEMSTETPFEFQKSRLEFALSSHPVKNFAIAIYADGKKYAYSGDGNFNQHTRELYRHCSFLVHEAYSIDGGISGHAKMADVLEMAKEQAVEKLALTHISRADRKKRRSEIDSLIRNSGINVIIPEPGEIHEL
jgi:ribonuclease BN (tRNA processing enzyme)